MRSVAPDSPGSAASQNSWSVVKVKPIAGSLATTTDQTIQTAKESSSAGIEIQQVAPRDRPARRAAQNSLSSGRQSSIRCGPEHADVLGLVDLLHLGQLGQLLELLAVAALLHRADGEVHPDQRDAEMTNSTMKQLCQTPVRSFSTPKAIGRTKPPRPPTRPTTPPTAPTWFG